MPAPPYSTKTGAFPQWFGGDHVYVKRDGLFLPIFDYTRGIKSMTEITTGLRSILSLPIIYELVQSIFGGRSERRMMVNYFIRPKPGDHIVDIGCGPAEILALMPDVQYVGYDPSARYIEHARKKFGSRGQFFVGRFGKDDIAKHEPFDIGILIGVLHHLDSIEATNLLALIRLALKPGARLVTEDPVLIEDQNAIARTLIKWDRGRNVRAASEYCGLAAAHFGTIRETVMHMKIPPYTLLIMECS
jgi:SAM-dependent methyltransferase